MTGASATGDRFGSVASVVYLALAYLFIFLPVLVLVLFSFQGSTLPVPPFTGPSLRWYREVLADERLLAALGNSLLVGVCSSLAGRDGAGLPRRLRPRAPSACPAPGCSRGCSWRR